MLQYLEIWVEFMRSDLIDLVKWLLKRDQITVYDAALVFKEYVFLFYL